MSLYEEFDSNIKECSCCYGDIDENNFVLYNEKMEGTWKSSKYCKICVAYMLENAWGTYIGLVGKADCAAALKRLIQNGPPINLRDPIAFACDNGTGEVASLYYDGAVHSAKLVGSLEEEERETFWNTQLAVLRVMNEIEGKGEVKSEIDPPAEQHAEPPSKAPVHASSQAPSDAPVHTSSDTP